MQGLRTRGYGKGLAMMADMSPRNKNVYHIHTLQITPDDGGSVRDEKISCYSPTGFRYKPGRLRICVGFIYLNLHGGFDFSLWLLLLTFYSPPCFIWGSQIRRLYRLIWWGAVDVGLFAFAFKSLTHQPK